MVHSRTCQVCCGHIGIPLMTPLQKPSFLLFGVDCHTPTETALLRVPHILTLFRLPTGTGANSLLEPKRPQNWQSPAALQAAT